ncbi:hypothetical protein [Streptomyces sp. NPDC001948]
MDVSPWLRPNANTSATDHASCRTFGREEGKHQMVPGRPYSVVAALETGRTSWTAVLDAVRLEPGADTAAVTMVQIRGVVERLVAAGQRRGEQAGLAGVVRHGRHGGATSTAAGIRSFGASTSSTRFACSSRPSAGPRPGFAVRMRPTGGLGW